MARVFGFVRGNVLVLTVSGRTQGVDASRAVSIEGPAGTAIFMHGLAPHASEPNTSDRPRWTLVLSYRAADPFPVYCGPMTQKNEAHVRLVRGPRARAVRFDLTSFPTRSTRTRWPRSTTCRSAPGRGRSDGSRAARPLQPS